MDLSALHERMHAVAGQMTFRALGEATSHNSETVRRYMQGQSPSAEFLAALCSGFDLNAQWLIMGRGPMKRSEARAHALKQANPSELLAAIAEALEKLTERVDRIELLVQTLESRVTAARAAPREGDPDGQAAQPARGTPGGGNDEPGSPEGPRIRIVADAVAKRPHTDAR